MTAVGHGMGIEYMPRIQREDSWENTYDNEDGIMGGYDMLQMQNSEIILQEWRNVEKNN